MEGMTEIVKINDLQLFKSTDGFNLYQFRDEGSVLTAWIEESAAMHLLATANDVNDEDDTRRMIAVAKNRVTYVMVAMLGFCTEFELDYKGGFSQAYDRYVSQIDEIIESYQERNSVSVLRDGYTTLVSAYYPGHKVTDLPHTQWMVKLVQELD